MPLKRSKRTCIKASGPDLFAAELRRNGSVPKIGEVFQREDVAIHFDRAEHLYARWPSPTCIISDGPYGVSGFPGDEHALPDSAWEHAALYKSVREAVATLPVYFWTETHISGILATDLHTLNTVLGATIEEQVVRTLNLIRTTWDPQGRYALYSFVRQPQTFPDVTNYPLGSCVDPQHTEIVQVRP